MWFKRAGRSLLHYQIPVVLALAVGYRYHVVPVYLATAYMPLLAGILGAERWQPMLRYFAFRASKPQPVRTVLWIVDRTLLTTAGAFVGPWLLASVLITYATATVVHLLASGLRLIPITAAILVGLVMLAELLPKASMQALLAVTGLVVGGYWLHGLSVLLYRVLVRDGLLAQLKYRLGGAFGGAGAVGASDFGGVLAVVGTTGLLSAATWADVDWSTAPDSGLPQPDAGLVNFASGLPMTGDGSFLDIAGNMYGTDMYNTALSDTDANADPFNT